MSDVRPTCVITEQVIREGVAEFVVAELLYAFENGCREFTIVEGGGVVGMMTGLPAES